MTTKTLLIEIGTEELPSRLLNKISLFFYENFILELKLHNILYKTIKSFSTPRRLALKIINIDTTEKLIKIKKRGPSIKNAYDQNGALTEAAIHWLKNCNIHINQSNRLKTKKGEWLSCEVTRKRENIELLLPKMIELALKKIFISKPMRWEINNEKFSRPIRNIVILLNDQIILGKVFNISSNNLLHNHISDKEKIEIKNAIEYPLILLQKYNIIADYTKRKEKIINIIQEKVKKINGYIKTKNLLIEEITNLVESPVSYLARFDKKFLNIPKKILIYTIEKQQKCFTVYNEKKDILPYFIFVANIHSKDSSRIIIGNEKVMHARLSDAEFFFKNDRKIKLEDYLVLLKKVLFKKNLGSLYEKTIRLKALVKWISQYTISNKENLIRAAHLSKCDLITNTVSEFPDLQGTIGMYYALEDQEKQDVAKAIEEQYLPSFSGDKLPHSTIGCILSIADKIDTLSGMFYIGNIPRSDKDPFAIRRLAIGILRIIIKQSIPLNLKDLIKKSLYLYDNKNSDNLTLCKQIMKFFTIRLFHWYEEMGYSIKVIKSVLPSRDNRIIDIDKKIKSILFFQNLENSKSILLSIKRICNILQKENKIIKESTNINISILTEIEEIILFDAIKKFDIDTKNLFKEKKYKEILLKTIELEKPIYNFFNQIKINHSIPEIRLNRLALLNILKQTFFKIADFSYLY